MTRANVLAQPGYCNWTRVSEAIRRVYLHKMPCKFANIEIPVWVMAFDARSFRPEFFDTADIPCPPSIRRSVHKRQCEFFFGRLAARAALSSFGYGQFEVPIGPSHQPEWPAGFAGSISHSRSLAGATVLQEPEVQGVGIDIEHVVSEQELVSLRTQVLTAREGAYLESLDIPLHLTATLVFSAKETFFKAAFSSVGRYFDFDAVSVRHIDFKNRVIRLDVMENLSASFSRGYGCDVSFHMIDIDAVLTTFAW